MSVPGAILEFDGLGQAAATKAHRHGPCALVHFPIAAYDSAAPDIGNRITLDLANPFAADADGQMAIGMNIQPGIRQVAY